MKTRHLNAVGPAAQLTCEPSAAHRRGAARTQCVQHARGPTRTDRSTAVALIGTGSPAIADCTTISPKTKSYADGER
ncbi:Uncharacterised protein [Clostridioides difficile]|nr:Uncharacterised protein [Clostridioides difficile]